MNIIPSQLQQQGTHSVTKETSMLWYIRICLGWLIQNKRKVDYATKFHGFFFFLGGGGEKLRKAHIFLISCPLLSFSFHLGFQLFLNPSCLSIPCFKLGTISYEALQRTKTSNKNLRELGSCLHSFQHKITYPFFFSRIRFLTTLHYILYI